MKMTIAELIESLEDFDPNTEVVLALQPSWPMKGRIMNICMEYDEDDNEKQLWIACSDNEDYGCPSEAWEDSEIYPNRDDEDDED